MTHPPQPLPDPPTADDEQCPPDETMGDVAEGSMLERLLDLAEAICEEIETWTPDLVVALYHSGQAPLRAALTLWDETRPAPFPPVVRTNLGREKIDRYDALRKEMRWHPLVAWVDSDWELAHSLAWVHEQQAWREELGQQVAEVLGEGVTPGRVLVIDDFWQEGTTWVFALGLLHSLYPAAESRYLSGALDGWRTALGKMWLEAHHPGVYEVLEAETRAAERQRVWLNCGSHFLRMVTGTEDVDPESLAWRPITAQSEAAQQLGRFLPPEAWLALPAWSYRTIEACVRERAGEVPRWSAAWRHSRDRTCRIDREQLRPAHLVLTQAWRQQRITRRSVAALCRLSPAQAGRLLKRLVRNAALLQQGRGRGTYYTLRPEEQQTVERWYPPEGAGSSDGSSKGQ